MKRILLILLGLVVATLPMFSMPGAEEPTTGAGERDVWF